MKVINLWEHKRGWGHDVFWFDWEQRKITGWLPATCRPHHGDEVRDYLESGRVARFKVKDVEWKLDPPDMFFATLADIGYMDDQPTPPEKEPSR